MFSSKTEDSYQFWLKLDVGLYNCTLQEERVVLDLQVSPI
jgi:hypothetical protein